jgi:hypothetical protein
MQILTIWKHYLGQLLNKELKILGKLKHITPICVPSSVSTVVAITILKSIDEVLLEIIRTEGAMLLRRSINLFILYGMRKNLHTDGRNLLLYLFIGRMGKLIVMTTGHAVA